MRVVIKWDSSKLISLIMVALDLITQLIEEEVEKRLPTRI